MPLKAVAGPAEVSQTEAFSRKRSHTKELVSPNALICWAFYLSVFAIPFMRVYIPGTGDRVGITRLVQLLLVCAVFSQPRICLRFVPVALFWFIAYCALRVASGLWFSPELSEVWWPNTLEWLQYSIPWTWMVFNVLQFPEVGRKGLWALVLGCALCSLFHIAGIGVAAVDNSLDVRTTVFGENANVVGATYAIAVIALIGLNMFQDMNLGRRLLLFVLLGFIGVGLAKTGSRTAAVMVAIGVMVLLFQARSFAPKIQRYTTLLIVGGVFASVVSQIPTVMNRFGNVNSSNLRQQEGRVRMMPVMWEMFLRSPIYGSGPDRYQVELTRRAMPHLVGQQRTISAHNLVLLLLVETGLIGLLIFSIGLTKVLVAAWRSRLKYCGYLPLALLMPFVLSGIVLSNPTHDQVFWLTVAYALAGES